MKKSIFVLLLICGFAFQNCKGQSDNEQKKVGTFKLNLVPLEAQMPDTIPASELRLTQREKITIKVIDNEYFLASQNSMKRIYADSVVNRTYLGLSESDTLFDVTFIFEEFPKSWFEGKKYPIVYEKLKDVGMSKSFIKVEKSKKE